MRSCWARQAEGTLQQCAARFASVLGGAQCAALCHPDLHRTDCLPFSTSAALQLGWAHWERQARRRILAAFPPAFPLF